MIENDFSKTAYKRQYITDLRAAAPPSNVVVRDAVTMQIKRIETPDGIPIIDYLNKNKGGIE